MKSEKTTLLLVAWKKRAFCYCGILRCITGARIAKSFFSAYKKTAEKCNRIWPKVSFKVG